MKSESQSNNKRIAKNTIFLYFRAILIMAISIFTSRVVLQVLGVNDYGIQNVVGGFVGMFSILSSSLVNASQRFISYELGKQNPLLNNVFCGTVTIHVFLALLLLVLFESFGLWFLNYKLNIDPDRIVAANWVFQFSVLTFCINIISTPYNACIVAHEKMSAFAYISIYEAIAKLLIAYLLWLTSTDRLIIYSFLLLCVAISVRIFYGFYCKIHFDECKFHFYIDHELFRSLLSFSGWNFLGASAGILITQGINVLSNIFFGVTINAARGIADQVNNAINQFVNNFMMAMNPQITQSHAKGDFDRMNTLMYRGAKYATLLYWIFGLILFVEADVILDVWLVEVPEHAALFLRLIIIFSIFQAMSGTLYIGVLATGDIKKYQILISLLYLIAFVICYMFFKLGLGPEYGYISMILAVFLAVPLRIWLLQQMIPDFHAIVYIKEVVLKTLPILGITYVISCFLSNITQNSLLFEFLTVTFVAVVVLPVLSFFIALDKSEKNAICTILRKIHFPCMKRKM